MAKRYAEVLKKECVACGTCVKACPKDAITVWKGLWAKVNENTCIGCGKCAKVCPADVISMKKKETAA